ncbi:MAG: hypothetical protein IJ906_10310, partial [Oscillospiraceae bacterium]|nr:hypothetical protein [Oscillospiraceae bacterium]
RCPSVHFGASSQAAGASSAASVVCDVAGSVSPLLPAPQAQRDSTIVIANQYYFITLYKNDFESRKRCAFTTKCISILFQAKKPIDNLRKT